MQSPTIPSRRLTPLVMWLVAAGPLHALDVILDGQPKATIVIHAPEEVDATKKPRESARRRGSPGDRMAAGVLSDWVRKITDAELPIVGSAPESGPVIYVGRAAVEAGLQLDDIDSPSGEGLRIRCDGRRILLAGQNETATVKAACALLEHWGCRFFLDHPLGEVHPRQRTLSVGRLDITAKPGFPYRSIWGSQWSGTSLWKIWNGAGGTKFSTQHAWRQYVPGELFAEHPEYFRMANGERSASDWYCTSNRDLRKVFAGGVIEHIRSGHQHPSISPPDGRGYCRCESCLAQDDPDSLEPSSGHVCISNRYADFYQEVAGIVGREFPDSVLSFYCYADYTQAPTSGIRLAPNLCAWIAPIRYSRYHRIGHPLSTSRRQLAGLIDGWAASAQKIGYRTYNYNLAECSVPFSKISIWKHDIPWLHERGCIGINLETLTNWQIYGPHIYLSIRLAYDPGADADAIMDDYFQKFYGPEAGPVMKDYWMSIDRAFDELACESGSFFALHLVYSDPFLRECRARIERAAAAARDDDAYAARVEMASEGLKNAEQFIAVRKAVNRGDFTSARRICDDLLARSETHRETKLGNHYTVNYLKRFLGTHVAAAAEATSAPRRLVTILPDKWRLTCDDEETGAERGFHRPGFEDSDWPEVATFSNPLNAQGRPDRQTILWYRCRIEVPKRLENPALFFVEVDGDATVFVNGRQVGASEKKRRPFSVELGDTLPTGTITIAVRVDHRSITDLFLGGIIRPVLLTAEKEPQPTQSKPADGDGGRRRPGSKNPEPWRSEDHRRQTGS
jgi:hypothetical protein